MDLFPLREAIDSIVILKANEDVVVAIHKIFSNSHHYSSQWKALSLSASTAHKIILLLTKQDDILRGYCVWLFDMVRSSIADPLILGILSSKDVIELLVENLLNYSNHENSSNILLKIVGEGFVGLEDIYNTVRENSGKVDRIKYSNFMTISRFTFMGLKYLPASTVKGLQLLLEIISVVESDCKAEYFVDELIAPPLLAHLSSSCKELDLMCHAAALYGQYYILQPSPSDRILESGVVQKVAALLEQSTSRSMEGLSRLVRPDLLQLLSILSSDPTVRVVVRDLVPVQLLGSLVDSEVPATLDATAHLFDILYVQAATSTQPNSAKNVSKFSFNVIAREGDSDTVTSSTTSTGLESTISASSDGFSDELESYLLPVLQCSLGIISTAATHNNKSSTPGSRARPFDARPSDTFGSRQSEMGIRLSKVSRFPTEMMFLQSREGGMGAEAVRPSELFTIEGHKLGAGGGGGGARFLDSTSFAVRGGGGSGFDRSGEEWRVHALECASKAVQLLGRRKQLRSLPSVRPLLAEAKAAIFKKFHPKKLSEFDLDDIIFADILAVLCGGLLPCWEQEVGQADVQDLFLHGQGVRRVSLLGCGADEGVPDCRTAAEGDGEFGSGAEHRGAVGNPVSSDEIAKVYGVKIFSNNDDSLKDLTVDWELENPDVLCRKILTAFLVSTLAGIEFLEILNTNDLATMLASLLLNGRHGLHMFPGMPCKCLQIITSLAYEYKGVSEVSSALVNVNGSHYQISPLQATPLSCAFDVCKYVTTAITDLRGKYVNRGPADDSLIGVYLSSLIALCPHDRQCRRHLVVNFRDVCSSVMRYGTSYLGPMLKLVLALSDCIGKINDFGEEPLTGLIVPALRMYQCGDENLCFLACMVIAELGVRHPGLAHKLFMRREIEDVLAIFLYQGCFVPHREACAAETRPHVNLAPLVYLESLSIASSSSSSSTSMPSTVSAADVNHIHLLTILRACVVCVRDVNSKPWWTPSGWSYHISIYAGGLRGRPLLQPHTVHQLRRLVRLTPCDYRLPITAACFEYATCLMYNCSDGNIVTRPRDSMGRSSDPDAPPNFESTIKQALQDIMLPLLPKALAVIMHRENSSTRESVVNTDGSCLLDRERAVEAPPQPGSKAGGAVQQQGRSAEGSDSAGGKNAAPQHPQPHSPREKLIRRLSTSVSSGIAAGGGLFKNRLLGKEAAGTGSGGSRSAQDSSPQSPGLYPQLFNHAWLDSTTPTNKAMESLAEKTVDGLYAFLCLDDMFPMSTYILNIGLFERVPLCASLAFTMICFPNNTLIQRRGIETYKCLADNNLEPAQLGMHAPTALMVAMAKLLQTPEIQASFAKLVITLASGDEFARDNLIRYSVQSGLADILREKVSESSYLSCRAVRALAAATPSVVTAGTRVVEAILGTMDAHPNDIRVQVEGLKTLKDLHTTKEFNSVMKLPTSEPVLKKCRKKLLESVKAGKLGTEYTCAEVESLLSDPVVSKMGESCTIS